jgi:hypothetical protein
VGQVTGPIADLALACKGAVAVVLVAAGGAKLADLRSFAATVRLFLPAATAAVIRQVVAIVVAAGEIATGAASLSSPQAGWLNLAVLVLCGGLLVVSVVGYLRFPGRACSCFGALSARSFNLAAIGRAGLITVMAALALAPVNAPLVSLGATGRLGLLAGAGLIAWCAWTATAAIGAGREPRQGLAP